MPSIPANGLEIGYDVLGAGPPLVMLHGSGSSGSDDFAAQVPMLSKAFLAYLPDARGHGARAGTPPTGFTYAMLVDDVAGLRRRPRASRRSTCSGSRWAR